MIADRIQIEKDSIDLIDRGLVIWVNDEFAIRLMKALADFHGYKLDNGDE